MAPQGSTLPPNCTEQSGRRMGRRSVVLRATSGRVRVEGSSAAPRGKHNQDARPPPPGHTRFGANARRQPSRPRNLPIYRCSIPGRWRSENHTHPRGSIPGRGKEDCTMGSSSDGLIRQLRAFRRKVSRRYPIRKMVLFGSRATGKARPDSDVDLIVVSESFERKNAVDRAYLMRLEWDLDYAVDFLCYTPEEFRVFSSAPGMVRQALTEGRAIPA